MFFCRNYLTFVGTTLKTIADMNPNFYCVIMAGGSGTRFWPMSRVARPKQFLQVESTGKSFIRHTYERFARIIPADNILVVTTDRLGNLVREHIPELKEYLRKERIPVR